MSDENRVRYRLSVHPEVSERVEQMAKKLGVHPQQMAYMAMGLGLTTLEQLTESMEKLIGNPDLMLQLMKAQHEQVSAAADDVLAEVKKQ